MCHWLKLDYVQTAEEGGREVISTPNGRTVQLSAVTVTSGLRPAATAQRSWQRSLERIKHTSTPDNYTRDGQTHSSRPACHSWSSLKFIRTTTGHAGAGGRLANRACIGNGWSTYRLQVVSRCHYVNVTPNSTPR